tara:strand:+ start:20272 stop:21483 length:1212 start_codon:yes stop_codon:yes gene_type:complete
MKNKAFISDVKKVYFKAFDNEISISEFAGAHYGKSEEHFWIPNNAVVNKKYCFVIFCLSKLYYFIVLLWLFAMPVIFIIEYIKWGKNVAKKHNPKFKDVFLYSSIGSNFNYIKRETEDYPTSGIILPWVRVGNIPSDISLIDICDISSPKIFFKSCTLAYLVTLQAMSDPKRIKRTLYTYTALRWFFVRLTLESYAFNSIWLTNHYDRWVVLLDSIAVEKRVMVQHGSLIDFSQPVPVTYTMQNKLRASWVLHLYNEDEYPVFCKCIFISPPEVKAFEVEISIDRSLCRGLKSILVLGNPRLQDKLMTAVKLLKKIHGQDLMVAYRPHPRESISALIKQSKKLDFIINADQKRIPETSIVLSYGSSLDELLLNYYPAKIINFDVSKKFDENHFVTLINQKLVE